MDIRQLRYFVAVVDAGSFTGAAARLNVAQSALSLHVRRMEERYATALLVRGRNGVTVTGQGAVLLDHARKILALISQAETDLTDSARLMGGEVTLGIPSGLARVLVPNLLSMARERHPAVGLKIVEGLSGSLEEWFAAGRLDLAILYKTDLPGAHETELAQETFSLICPPDGGPAGAIVRLSEAAQLPLALPGAANSHRKAVDQAAAALGLSLDVRFEIDSLSTILAMVAEGRAFSILTPAAVKGEVAAGRVREAPIFDPAITRAVVLVADPRHAASAATHAVTQVVVAVAAGLIDNGGWPALRPAP